MSDIPFIDPESELLFQDKITLFTHNFLQYFSFLHQGSHTHFTLTKKFYLTLSTEALLLEDMLDFHGARNNEKWFFFRELCAVTCHLSMAAYYHLHLLNRFFQIPVVDRPSHLALQSGESVDDFFRLSLSNLALPILTEAKHLQIEIPTTPIDSSVFQTTMTRDRLPYTTDSVDHEQQQIHVIKIVSDFLKISEEIEQLAYRCQFKDDLASLIPDHINEAIIWKFEMQLHNLQSIFDTYVGTDGFRHATGILLDFRRTLSLVIDLFQIAGKLLHLYERHFLSADTKSRYQHVRQKLRNLIKPDDLLYVTIHYAIETASTAVVESRKLAQIILNEYIETEEIEVPIPRNMGFHSRPSLMVARIVQHYGGSVSLHVGEDKFDASSVLDIQWAGGKIQKENIQYVVFRGDRRALHDLQILANVNYGEDLMGKGVALPKELGYLK